ncbi:KRR1 small subunit processome component protein [Rutstroemia sp. NJR-2017a WRK4]|nr:KRR1 small subunit processome component protein [Rutstroemia sp. NJR-2017a WRK4]
MAPKVKSKRTFKSTSSKPSAPPSTDPPAPFARPPKKLEPFLEKLSKYHIYITHIDSHPPDFKRKIFLVPVCMNVAIIALLAWRIFVVFPYYMRIVFSMMGQHNETTIDSSNLSLNEMGWEILRRGSKFMIDLILYMFVWPWPRDFFLGRAIGNPIAWRLGVGFREKEIIVRRSRKWDRTIGDFLKEDNEEGMALLMKNVQTAISPMWMQQKTGYLMLNKEWDLDWKAIVQATKMVDKKTMDLEDFKTTILAWHAAYGWMVATEERTPQDDREELGRKKITAFRDELTKMGKENLFFRWIELVQFEASRPEGWGPEQQKKTVEKARELFEAQGVDFEKFWEKIGGMEGLPGYDEL